MASLELRNENYRVVFRYGGKKFSTTLNTTNYREAQGLRGGGEKTLLRLERGLIDLPLGADICSFVLTEGRRTEKPEAVEPLTLAKLVERYETELPVGTMEANSLQTVLLHMQHFRRILGGGVLCARAPVSPLAILRPDSMSRELSQEADQSRRHPQGGCQLQWRLALG